MFGLVQSGKHFVLLIPLLWWPKMKKPFSVGKYLMEKNALKNLGKDSSVVTSILSHPLLAPSANTTLQPLQASSITGMLIHLSSLKLIRNMKKFLKGSLSILEGISGKSCLLWSLSSLKSSKWHKMHALMKISSFKLSFSINMDHFVHLPMSSLLVARFSSPLTP